MSTWMITRWEQNGQGIIIMESGQAFKPLQDDASELLSVKHNILKQFKE